MPDSEEDLCPNCCRPLALFAGHGCGETTDQCGARDAACWDCVLECCQQTIVHLRRDLERYQNKFGALRPGIGEPKSHSRPTHVKPTRLPKYTTRRAW